MDYHPGSSVTSSFPAMCVGKCSADSRHCRDTSLCTQVSGDHSSRAYTGLPDLFASKRLSFSKRITTGSGGMLADSDLYRPSCLAQVNETLEKLFYTEKPRWIPRGTNEKRHACKYLQVNSWTLWRMESYPHKGSEAGDEPHLPSFNFLLREHLNLDWSVSAKCEIGSCRERLLTVQVCEVLRDTPPVHLRVAGMVELGSRSWWRGSFCLCLPVTVNYKWLVLRVRTRRAGKLTRSQDRTNSSIINKNKWRQEG